MKSENGLYVDLTRPIRGAWLVVVFVAIILAFGVLFGA